MTRVGYVKIGRSMPLPPDRWGEVGGDNEPIVLLHKLATRHPEVEWVLVGRNTGEDPQAIGLPANVVNPWTTMRDEAKAITKAAKDDKQMLTDNLHALTRDLFMGLDGLIVWAGQHGTSNSPIPVVGGDRVTDPQISFVNYGSYVVRGINAWRDQDPVAHQELWLCPDVRNYLKCRDLKWPPPPILGQYDWKKWEKHYRFGDPNDAHRWAPHLGIECKWSEAGVWAARHQYLSSRLELVGIPSSVPFNDVWEDRLNFGMIVNENRAYVTKDRLSILKEWVLPLQPDFIHGKWSPKSLGELGMDITTVPWNEVWTTIQRARCTLTTPASGSGWATTKPWEAFGSGTVCFFHPFYDDQGSIIPRPDQVKNLPDDDPIKQLTTWLRVQTPADLQARVTLLSQDRDTWRWLVNLQRWYFDLAMGQAECIDTIGDRLGIRS